MRCPRCEHAVAESDATCGSCGQTLSTVDAIALPGQRPAHLAVLDGAAKEPPKPAPKPRLVSRAGPAVPVTTNKPGDDAVPAGAASWMARLEQAKRVTPADGTPVRGPATPPPLRTGSSSANGHVAPPPRPPPLPKKPAFAVKPAHLLVAELEAAEKEKKDAKARASSIQTAEDEISKSEIANVEIAKPDTDIADRHVPRWVYAIAVVVVLGGIAGAYIYADKKAPVPIAEADPELRAKAEKARTANAAVEEGHTLLGDQKVPAKIDLAIAAYKRALAIDSQFARAERALGVAYAAKGDDATAAEHYKRFLQLDPAAPEASQVKAIIAKYESKAKK